MKKEIIRGVLQGNERGYAFLVPLAEEETLREGRGGKGIKREKKDYFIPHSELKGAMHGDTVLAETTENSGERGERTTARVLKVLERGITELVGTYFTARAGGFVRPDDGRYYTDIFVPFGKGIRAKAGDKIVCKILSYPRKQSPEGIVTKILGRQFEKKAELASVLYEFKLRDEFPFSAIEEAKNLPSKITSKSVKKRKDFRNETVFTIDGEDARDFDDAVSIRKSEDGYYHLGVHIADVSEYVKPRGDIDNEAFERGTSVYFPEKVIPMLPERLCNDLCSLREGEERLTLSCLMKIDQKGKVIDREICPSVIRSKRRLTYTEVRKFFDGEETALKSLEDISVDLTLMREVAEILKKKRAANGSIDLDVKDSRISVDENGEIEVCADEKDLAHGLIEEFMIAANCTVAEYAFYLSIPFIYRAHEDPSEERLERFYAFLEGLGISARRNREGVYSTDFQKILSAAEGSPVFPLVNRVMLRTMQKAYYTTEAKGHFGLAEEHYCHFTSPIRRYPDLVVHRILKYVIENGTDKIEETFEEDAQFASVQSSATEKNAEAAERAVDEYYKLLYISGKEGEEFDGVVSGVLNSGMFVELECGVEGFIRSETLSCGRIICDRDRYTLTVGKKTYRLGEMVKIVVAGVNLADRRAEFVLSEKEEEDIGRKTKTNADKKSGVKNETKRGRTEKWKKRR